MSAAGPPTSRRALRVGVALAAAASGWLPAGALPLAGVVAVSLALLGLLVLSGRAALREDPAGAALVAVGVACGAFALVAAGQVALFMGQALPEEEGSAYLLRMARALGGGGAALLLALEARSALFGPLTRAAPAEPLAAARRWLPVGATLLVGGALHALVFAALPVVVSIDSYVNVWEAPFFEPTEVRSHQAPVYVWLVKACARGDLHARLVALVLVQHAAVVCSAAALAHVVGLLTSRAWTGVLAGLLVAGDAQLAVFASSVMHEAFATSIMVLAAVALLWTLRLDGWSASVGLFGAGLLAALAALTRQALQLWFLVPVALVLVWGAWRPRRRAAAWLLAGAIGPVVAVMSHHYAFRGHFGVTGSAGRNLLYRVIYDMPPLEPTGAAQDDPVERARGLVWAKRETAWLGPYNAIRDELGWSDPEVDRFVVSLYVERLRRHPLRFARVSVECAWGTLVNVHPPWNLLDFHRFVLFDNEFTPAAWRALPLGERDVPWLEAWSALCAAAAPVVLVLALACPFVVEARSRPLATLCAGSALYVALITALAAVPLGRYRLPATPFLLCAAALTLDAGVVAARRRLGSPGA